MDVDATYSSFDRRLVAILIFATTTKIALEAVDTFPCFEMKIVVEGEQKSGVARREALL